MHLTDWPAADRRCPRDARRWWRPWTRCAQVASVALSLRKARGLRVRQPLAALTVAAAGRRQRSRRSPTSCATRSTSRTSSSPTTSRRTAGSRSPSTRGCCGPRLGGDTQKVISAVKAGEWSAEPDGTVTAAGHHAAAGGVHRAAGRGGRRAHRRAARQHRPGAAGHGGHAGAGAPRARRATSSAWCSRRAATPGSTCPTGSRSSWTRPSACGRRSAHTRPSWPGRCWPRPSPTDRWAAAASEGAVTAADGTSTQVKVQVTP